MPRIRRKLYGWLRKPGEWCLSVYPPDVAVPFQLFPSMKEAEEYADHRRSDVIWFGDALAHRMQLILSREN